MEKRFLRNACARDKSHKRHAGIVIAFMRRNGNDLYTKDTRAHAREVEIPSRRETRDARAFPSARRVSFAILHAVPMFFTVRSPRVPRVSILLPCRHFVLCSSDSRRTPSESCQIKSGYSSALRQRWGGGSARTTLH